MGYNDQLEKPISKFPKYFNRKKLLVTIGAILLVVLITVVVWVVWWNITPVLTVNGEKISRQEYNTEKSLQEKFYEYNNDEKSLKNLDQITKDKLTEEAIIRAESKKRGIKVSAAEINVEYQKLVKQYKSEAEFTQTIKSAYNYTPQLTKDAIEIRLLKDKLKLEVLKGYDVTEYLVRYDLGTRGLKENPTSKDAIDAAYVKLQQGSTMEKLATDPICQPSICGIASLSHVNEVTAIDLFFASKGEDYAAISKLTKAGEITGIVKSSGGYYVIYRADRISGGKFNTWDDFIKDYKSKYVSDGTTTKIAAEYNKLSNWLFASLSFNSIAYAVSVTSDGSNCNYNSPQGPDDKYSPIAVTGSVTDAITGDPIAGATIRAYISNYNGSCYKQFATQKAKDNLNYDDIVNFCPTCGRSDNTVTTNSHGKYSFDDSNTFECHFHYTWIYEANNYETEKYDGVPPNNLQTGHLMNGQSMISDVSLVPTPHDLTIKIVNTNGSSGTVTSSDSNNPINCTDNSGNCFRTFTHYGVETTLTATPGSGSLFSSWSGQTTSNPQPPYCTLTSPTGCTVRMGMSRTITATFYKVNSGCDPATDPNHCEPPPCDPATDPNHCGNPQPCDPATDPDHCGIPQPPEFNLTPTVTVNPDIFESGVDLGVTSTIINTGPDSSQNPTACALTRQVNGAQTGTIDCTSSGYSPGSNSGPSQTDTSTGSLNPGDQVCFTLTLSPSSYGGGSVSDRKCATVVKKPKTQIWGGDLLVGKDVTTSYSTKSGKTYGSWAEYGIVASGGISGAASGAAFAGPGLAASYKACETSKLSFTNTNADSSTCNNYTTKIGHYNNAAGMPDVGASFPVNASTPRLTNPTNLTNTSSGVYTADGNISVYASGTIPTRVWIVINAPTSDITISDNIRYSNGNINKLSDIPQVVIIAKNINIKSNVTNIDAWLVAENGNINTCSDVSIGGKLSSSICNNKLTVNGPVIANKLYLYRTAGSGSGTSSGDPAEVFNLRADAYLWAAGHDTNNSYIQTVYTTELPPRF